LRPGRSTRPHRPRPPGRARRQQRDRPAAGGRSPPGPLSDTKVGLTCGNRTLRDTGRRIWQLSEDELNLTRTARPRISDLMDAVVPEELTVRPRYYSLSSRTSSCFARWPSFPPGMQCRLRADCAASRLMPRPDGGPRLLRPAERRRGQLGPHQPQPGVLRAVPGVQCPLAAQGLEMRAGIPRRTSGSGEAANPIRPSHSRSRPKTCGGHEPQLAAQWGGIYPARSRPTSASYAGRGNRPRCVASTRTRLYL
jgi:hypothetical protein